MKKLYMFAAATLLTAGSAAADTLTFALGGTEYANGETVIFSEAEIEDYGADGKHFMFDPHATLTSDVAGSVQVVAESLTEGKNIQMCAGGACEMGPKVTKNLSISANTPLDLEFEAAGDTYSADEPIPVIKSKLTASYSNGQGEVSLYVTFDKDNSAVKVVFVDESFYPTADGIAYNINGTATASLYDMSGKCVLTADINGQGTLSTASIPAGIYVYNLKGAGNHSGKILVK